MATAYWESSRPRGGDADEPDDFDEFDPTPYGGGYDLFVTYGRPLPPTEETCYPCSAPSTSYEAPHYSASEPSPYGHHAKPQPAYGFRPQQEQQPTYGGGYGSRPETESESEPTPYGHHAKPQPAYGFRPQQEQQPSYGGGYGSRPEPAEEDGGGYGSGYGRKRPEEEDSYGGSGYGSGYGRKPQAEESYVSGGYGGQTRPEESYGSTGYGSGYGSRPQQEEGYGYGRKPQVEESYGSEYGSGYGRKPQVEESYGSEYGSGYGRKPQVEESYGSEYSSGYGKKPQVEESYGSGYGSRPQGGEEYGSGRHGSGGYGYGRKTQEEGYGGSGYGYGRKTTEEDEGAYGSGGNRKPYGEETQGSYGGYERPSYGGGEEYQGSYSRKKHASSFPFELCCFKIFSLVLLRLCMLECEIHVAKRSMLECERVTFWDSNLRSNEKGKRLCCPRVEDKDEARHHREEGFGSKLGAGRPAAGAAQGGARRRRTGGAWGHARRRDGRGVKLAGEGRGATLARGMGAVAWCGARRREREGRVRGGALGRRSLVRGREGRARGGAPRRGSLAGVREEGVLGRARWRRQGGARGGARRREGRRPSLPEGERDARGAELTGVSVGRRSPTEAGRGALPRSPERGIGAGWSLPEGGKEGGARAGARVRTGVAELLGGCFGSRERHFFTDNFRLPERHSSEDGGSTSLCIS